MSCIKHHRFGGGACPYCEGEEAEKELLSKRYPIILEGLELLRGISCQSYTKPSGECLKSGRKVNAEYANDQACTSCIAHHYIELAEAIRE